MFIYTESYGWMCAKCFAEKISVLLFCKYNQLQTFVYRFAKWVEA